MEELYLLQRKIENVMFLKFQGHCPLHLLKNVPWKQARALGNEEGYSLNTEQVKKKLQVHAKF
jgi:hypothetical protein